MRSGRGFANGRGGGRRKLFFLESCLLVLLHNQAGYGYSLMDGLQEFGFNTETMNISILYRACAIWKKRGWRSVPGARRASVRNGASTPSPRRGKRVSLSGWRLCANSAGKSRYWKRHITP
jgi:hypothetical protein